MLVDVCLLLLSCEPHPEYRLVVAANRDEYYHRASDAARFWTDHPEVLAGRDRVHGGTWFGVSRRGRWAALTNVREPGVSPGERSRGLLVRDFLTGGGDMMSYLEDLAATRASYSGFNLVVGDEQRIGYYSNRGGPPRYLEPGVYGVSNHLLDTPWPKVARGRRGLRRILEGPAAMDALFELLGDHSTPDDKSLPDTGVGLAMERALAPMFVRTQEYGTRCSTVLMWRHDRRILFDERCFIVEQDGSTPTRYRSSAFEFGLS